MKKIFTLLLSTAILTFTNAQVVYYDTIPDVQKNITDSIELNLDMSGTWDVKIYVEAQSYTSSKGYSITTNSVWIDSYSRGLFVAQVDTNYAWAGSHWSGYSGTYQRVTALNQGDSICGQNFEWWWGILAENGIITSTQGQQGHRYGEFLGQNDKFIATKLPNNIYSWIRLDVASDASNFTVKDFAYEASGGCLTAGEGTPTTTIKERSDVFDKVTINNGLDFINVLISDDKYLNSTLYIYTSNGKEVKSQNITSLNTRVDLSNLSNGSYIATLRYADGGYSKIIIKN